MAGLWRLPSSNALRVDNDRQFQHSKPTSGVMGRGATVLEVLLYTIQGRKLRPSGHAMEKLTLNSTLIDTLWRDNQDLVDQFLKNDFLRFQAEGTTENTISSYQYYTVVSIAATSIIQLIF